MSQPVSHRPAPDHIAAGRGLATMRVSALLAAYRAGDLDPVAVAERVHAAATAQAAEGNAWIEIVDRATLLARARELSASARELPLYGIPVALKDNIDLAGVPTTAACPGFARVPETNATAVARLLEAGAMIVGKTNLDQFATGLVGTRSPYGACSAVDHPEHVSGGSSSGSALAVAGGVVSLALGTDTAGSGRVPAAFNGIVGVKPTRGAVSTAGVVPACRSLDCVSVFSADVDGGRRALSVLAAEDPADPYSRAWPRTGPARQPGPLRIAVPRADQLDALDGPSQEAWAAAVAHARERFDTVVDFDLEPFLAAGRLLYQGPWVSERYAAVGDLLEAGVEGADPVVSEIVLGGGRFTAADAFTAQEELAAIARRAVLVWRDADALLLPTVPTHPTIAEVRADPVAVNSGLGVYSTFVNLLDLCAVSVPARSRPDGLPFGVTLMAPAFEDMRLLELARTWATSTDEGATVDTTATVDTAAPVEAAATVELVVCGAHMRGLPLNAELLAAGATFSRAATTAPEYRLFALPGDPPRAGLLRAGADELAAGIEVELWRLPADALGGLLTQVPAPLSIGSVQLDGGRWVRGFLCEAHGVEQALEITALGGWRAHLTAEAVTA